MTALALMARGLVTRRLLRWQPQPRSGTVPRLASAGACGSLELEVCTAYLLCRCCACMAAVFRGQRRRSTGTTTGGRAISDDERRSGPTPPHPHTKKPQHALHRSLQVEPRQPSGRARRWRPLTTGPRAAWNAARACRRSSQGMPPYPTPTSSQDPSCAPAYPASCGRNVMPIAKSNQPSQSCTSPPLAGLGQAAQGAHSRA